MDKQQNKSPSIPLPQLRRSESKLDIRLNKDRRHQEFTIDGRNITNDTEITVFSGLKGSEADKEASVVKGVIADSNPTRTKTAYIYYTRDTGESHHMMLINVLVYPRIKDNLVLERLESQHGEMLKIARHILGKEGKVYSNEKFAWLAELIKRQPSVFDDAPWKPLPTVPI